VTESQDKIYKITKETDWSMEDIEHQLKKQQEEIERLKEQAKRQKWWNVVFAFRS